MIIINSYFNADYQNGKIYHVTFEKNNKHNIGSTTQILEDRLDEHKLVVGEAPVTPFLCGFN